MEPNYSLLENTMVHIRSNPELHNQASFFERGELGMTACFAGRALLLAGYQPVMATDNSAAVYMPDGTIELAWIAAQKLLGLTYEQASNLFTPANTSHMLELMVKDVLNGAPLKDYGEYLSDGS